MHINRKARAIFSLWMKKDFWLTLTPLPYYEQHTRWLTCFGLLSTCNNIHFLETKHCELVWWFDLGWLPGSHHSALSHSVLSKTGGEDTNGETTESATLRSSEEMLQLAQQSLFWETSGPPVDMVQEHWENAWQRFLKMWGCPLLLGKIRAAQMCGHGEALTSYV